MRGVWLDPACGADNLFERQVRMRKEHGARQDRNS